MNTSGLLCKSSFLPTQAGNPSSILAAGMHPLVWCCACTAMPRRWEMQRPLPMRQSLPSESKPGIPPLHRDRTRAHPHVPLQDDLMPAAPLWRGQLSFLQRLATPYSSALDHNFLLSPQKPYFLPGVLSSSFFHPSRVDPSLLKTQRKEEDSLQPSGPRKAALTWADTTGRGPAHSLWPHNSSQLAFLP